MERINRHRALLDYGDYVWDYRPGHSQDEVNYVVNSTEAANYGVTPVLVASRINIRSAPVLRGSLYFIRLNEFPTQFILFLT